VTRRLEKLQAPFFFWLQSAEMRINLYQVAQVLRDPICKAI